MTLPLAVRPMAQKLMFSTKMSLDEILEATRHVPGGEGPSMSNAQLVNQGRSTAEILLGKAPDPNISFDPVAPNLRTFDLDSELTHAGAVMATAFKASGYLSPNLGGPGRMA
jgi:hypothetical protein